MPLVTIIGATGYIGSHTCLAFLMDRGFRVRGIVRETTDESKLEPLKRACLDLWNELELVEANLLDPQSLERAVAGSSFVVASACPRVYEDHTIEKPRPIPKKKGKKKKQVNEDIADIAVETQEKKHKIKLPSEPLGTQEFFQSCIEDAT